MNHEHGPRPQGAFVVCSPVSVSGRVHSLWWRRRSSTRQPHGYWVRVRGFYTCSCPRLFPAPRGACAPPSGSASPRQASTAHPDLLDGPERGRSAFRCRRVPHSVLVLKRPGRRGRVHGCPHISPEAAAEPTPTRWPRGLLGASVRPLRRDLCEHPWMRLHSGDKGPMWGCHLLGLGEQGVAGSWRGVQLP